MVTQKLTPKVNFSVIGAQKSGTRALHHFLAHHPEIGLSLPTAVEPHYFDQGVLTDTSDDFAGYHELFSAQNLARLTGDITPIYLFKRGCLERMAAYNPDMKIIVLLRDPVARAHSHWAMVHERGDEPRPFWRAILHEALHSLRHGQHPFYSYVQRGFYGHQIARLFTIFPREQCLVLHNSALRHSHEKTLSQVYEFLGVAQVEIPPQETIHSRKYGGMAPLLRRMLRLIYASDIRRLEKLTGLDCAEWRK